MQYVIRAKLKFEKGDRWITYLFGPWPFEHQAEDFLNEMRADGDIHKVTGRVEEILHPNKVTVLAVNPPDRFYRDGGFVDRKKSNHGVGGAP